VRRDLFWSLVFLAFPYALAGCGSRERPARSPEEIARTCMSGAKVEAQFIAETLQACDGHESTDDCPAFPAIDAKYMPLREQAMRECK
jgi:hypothetical protein